MESGLQVALEALHPQSACIPAPVGAVQLGSDANDQGNGHQAIHYSLLDIKPQALLAKLRRATGKDGFRAFPILWTERFLQEFEVTFRETNIAANEGKEQPPEKLQPSLVKSSTVLELWKSFQHEGLKDARTSLAVRILNAYGMGTVLYPQCYSQVLSRIRCRRRRHRKRFRLLPWELPLLFGGRLASTIVIQGLFTSADDRTSLAYIDFSSIHKIRARHCRRRHDCWNTEPHRDPYLVAILLALAQQSCAEYSGRKEYSVHILAAKTDVEVQALYLYSAVIPQLLLDGLKRPYEVPDASSLRLNIEYSVIDLVDVQPQIASCLLWEALDKHGLCSGVSNTGQTSGGSERE